MRSLKTKLSSIKALQYPAIFKNSQEYQIFGNLNSSYFYLQSMPQPCVQMRPELMSYSALIGSFLKLCRVKRQVESNFKF